MTKRKIKYSNTSNKKLKRKNNLEKEIKKILSAFPDNKSDYGNIITKNLTDKFSKGFKWK